MAANEHRALRAKILASAKDVAINDIAPVLVAKAIAAGEGELTAHGAFSTSTGVFTGRSEKDKFIVRDRLTEDTVWWDNSFDMSEAQFDLLLADFLSEMEGRALYLQDLDAGADPAEQLKVSVFTDGAWHALFIRNLLIRRETPHEAADVTILHLPGFKADPERHGTRSETVIALNLSRNLVLIGGTGYAGEIKKSVFSLFNFHAPRRGVLPMHCSANIGPEGDTALFFGLSGTGKTTLSSDPERPLIGDDEHGWTDDGVFNLEGGCYAKTVNLSQKAEPEIFGATRSFGTVLENVVLNAAKEPVYEDISLTENTRAAYPLDVLPNVAPGGVGGTPRTVVFLTADAFGVLPPIARLTPEQAVYHFLSGYTAKVAGTARGVTEPQATFSACFGAPFMPLHPSVYGELLEQRLRESGASTWLLNTGWMGGAYGVGKRIDIASTRRLLSAALAGELDRVEMRIDPVFGFAVPKTVEGIRPELMDPRRSWADPDQYDATAQKLLQSFIANFATLGARGAAHAAAGPQLARAAE